MCDLSISPTRPVSVDALVGSDVTLAVSHSGASQPLVTWFMEGLPIVIWTISDDTSPDVASDHSSILHVDRNGSLTFRNVSLSYNGTYTVEMTQIGEIRVSATFDLFVYGEWKAKSFNDFSAILFPKDCVNILVLWSL